MGDRERPHTCLSDDSDHVMRHVTSHYFGCLNEKQQILFMSDPMRTREERDEIQKAERKMKAQINRLLQFSDVADLKGEIHKLRGFFKHKRITNASIDDNAQPNEIVANGPSSTAIDAVQQCVSTSEAHVNAAVVPPRYEMKATMIYFNPQSPQDLELKKMSVHDLEKETLSDGEPNPLREACPAEKFRYFHIPHNHMKWVMQAIATLNGEDVPKYHGIHQDPRIDKMSKTEIIFRPQFWRGQQHGGSEDPVHARYMRPHCESICTNKSSVDKEAQKNDNNLVLFMPYTHWETDRQRDRFSKVIQKRTEDELICVGRTELEKKERRKWKTKNEDEERLGHKMPVVDTDTATLPDKYAKTLSKERAALEVRVQKCNTFFDVTMAISDLACKGSGHELIVGKNTTKLANIKKYFQPETPRSMAKMRSDFFDATTEEGHKVWVRNVLLQLFLRAAALYEKIAWHDAEEMIKASLYESPPLHPRRTLDQAYYWTLKSTKVRDRDQTVYRATASNRRYMHHPGCREKAMLEKDDEEKKNKCRHHTHCWKKTGCDQCMHDIRMRSSIIMVDQLWLWVSDGNTISTAFPGRRPRHKHDASGVHKSIRTRLIGSRQGEIQTIYDLALLIINQASKVFHDRTITSDGQPPVMSYYANAIGNLNNKQTIAYNHLWRCALILGKERETQDATTIENLEKYILSIDTEGGLLREIDDVKDELRMMIYFKEQQQHVLEEFGTHVKQMLQRSVERHHRRQRERPNTTLENLSENLEHQTTHVHQHRLNRTNESPWVVTKEAKTWSLENIDDRKKSLKGQMAELKSLHSRAEQTTAAIQHLLNLKQQQASLIQARDALEQSKETVRQGLSIMAFTIITVLFLPLSFCASFFGMNVIDFQSGLATLRQEIEIIFPTSLLITFIACILAFNKSVRAFLYSTVSYSYYRVITRIGLYPAWKSLKIDSRSIYGGVGRSIREMKREAIEENSRRKEARAAAARAQNQLKPSLPESA